MPKLQRYCDFDTGPDAPLLLDRKVAATHFEHAHDFYKPAGQFFPVVRCKSMMYEKICYS